MRPPVPFAALVLVGTAACSQETALSYITEETGSLPVEVTPSTATPTVLTVEWNSGTPGHSWVEYGTDGLIDQATPLHWSEDGSAQHQVIGLKAGHSYTLRGVTELEGGGLYTTDEYVVELEPQPAELPTMARTVYDEDLTAGEGYVLAAIAQDRGGWLALLDRDGDYVWWHDAGEGTVVPSVELALNGRDILYAAYDVEQTEDIGELRRVSLTDGIVSRTRLYRGHHDFAELPTGEISWLAYDDFHTVVNGEYSLVTRDVIRVAPEGTLEDGEDASSIMFNSLLSDQPLHSSCSHNTGVVHGTAGMDWTHGNSLVYDGETDGLYMMARHIDTLYRVDPSTGRLDWKHRAQSNGENPNMVPWSHPHFSYVSGHDLLVFDNGDHRQPKVSAVVHFELDSQTGELSQRYRYEDPEGRYIAVLGDAQLLPGGRYLSSWLTAGTITELHPTGGVVWQLEASLGSGVARLAWVPDLYELVED